MVHSSPKNAKSWVRQSQVCYFHTTHSCANWLNNLMYVILRWKMFLLHWKTQQFPAVSPLDPTEALKRAPWTPSRKAHARCALRCFLGFWVLFCFLFLFCFFSFFFLLFKRFLINGAPIHPLPTGTLKQSYATGSASMSMMIPNYRPYYEFYLLKKNHFFVKTWLCPLCWYATLRRM